MNLMNYAILSLFTMWLCIQANAQVSLSTKSKKAIAYYTQADNFRVRGQFDQAIELLQQAISKDDQFEEAYFRLGVTYVSAANLTMACETLEKGLLLVKNLVTQKPYYYLLSDVYMRRGNYEKALAFSKLFLASEKSDQKKIEKVYIWKTQCEYAIQHRADGWPYDIKVLSDTVNAYYMQYFPTITADEQELIFTIRSGKANNDNEDIVIVRKDKNNRWGRPTSLSAQINSNYREGASSISADGRKIIFTICGPYGCDLYESNKEGDEWSKPQNLGLGVNTAGWEAQPSLSADGNELYFVSDRKGGQGGYDIWYSKKVLNGSWDKAINLGKPINTPLNEIAPFIHVNNQNLYFSSDGMPGFGNYDIYVSEKTNGQWSLPTNMGFPLNNYEDQYSFTVSSDGQSAYYSKEETNHSSKIYVTSIPEKFKVTKKGNVVKGIVRDALTQKPIQTRIYLKELSANQIQSQIVSDSITGSYVLVVPGKSEYALFTDKPGYLFTSLNFDYHQTDLDKPLIMDIVMQPIKKGAIMRLNNIFFHFDSYQLLDKSKIELQEVINFLWANPQVYIEISGHTDNSGNEKYNQQLSLKRAQSVGAYIKSHQINPARIKEIGYGSLRPLKPNESEQNRQFNRRIEFKIAN